MKDVVKVVGKTGISVIFRAQQKAEAEPDAGLNLEDKPKDADVQEPEEDGIARKDDGGEGDKPKEGDDDVPEGGD